MSVVLNVIRLGLSNWDSIYIPLLLSGSLLIAFWLGSNHPVSVVIKVRLDCKRFLVAINLYCANLILISSLELEVMNWPQVSLLMKNKGFCPFNLLIGHIELNLIRVNLWYFVKVGSLKSLKSHLKLVRELFFHIFVIGRDGAGQFLDILY